MSSSEKPANAEAHGQEKAEKVESEGQLGNASKKVYAFGTRVLNFARRRGEPIDTGNAGERRPFWRDLPLLFSGLFAKDLPTRRASFFFFIVVLIALTIPVVSLRRHFHRKALEQKRVADIMMERDMADWKKESEVEKRRDSIVTLGSFVVELKKLPNQPRNSLSVGLAEVEIVLLCDGKKTRDSILESMVQIRSHLSDVLTAMDREELLSKEGKRRLREMLRKDLNNWLPEGKVQEVYIPKLLEN